MQETTRAGACRVSVSHAGNNFGISELARRAPRIPGTITMIGETFSQFNWPRWTVGFHDPPHAKGAYRAPLSAAKQALAAKAFFSLRISADNALQGRADALPGLPRCQWPKIVDRPADGITYRSSGNAMPLASGRASGRQSRRRLRTSSGSARRVCGRLPDVPPGRDRR